MKMLDASVNVLCNFNSMPLLKTNFHDVIINMFILLTWLYGYYDSVGELMLEW